MRRRLSEQRAHHTFVAARDLDLQCVEARAAGDRRSRVDAVDLPDASVAIQISGTFGSRQEEAQRLGRILRPKSDGRSAFFYSVVTRDTRDQEFAARRQRFLMEQGYQYDVVINGVEDRSSGTEPEVLT